MHVFIYYLQEVLGNTSRYFELEDSIEALLRSCPTTSMGVLRLGNEIKHLNIRRIRHRTIIIQGTLDFPLEFLRNFRASQRVT